MDLKFETMTETYAHEVMAIFNYYIENSFAAYPEQKLPELFYNKFLEMTKGYPAFVIIDPASETVIGFCFLRSYNPLPAFRETVEISYFIHQDYVGKGIGKAALQKLETAGKALGIKHILAGISSLNEPSLKFHRKNGFSECGRFHNIGQKRGTSFDVIWMEKSISEII